MIKYRKNKELKISETLTVVDFLFASVSQRPPLSQVLIGGNYEGDERRWSMLADLRHTGAGGGRISGGSDYYNSEKIY